MTATSYTLIEFNKLSVDKYKIKLFNAEEYLFFRRKLGSARKAEHHANFTLRSLHFKLGHMQEILFPRLQV